MGCDARSRPPKLLKIELKSLVPLADLKESSETGKDHVQVEGSYPRLHPVLGNK